MSAWSMSAEPPASLSISSHDCHEGEYKWDSICRTIDAVDRYEWGERSHCKKKQGSENEDKMDAKRNQIDTSRTALN